MLELRKTKFKTNAITTKTPITKEERENYKSKLETAKGLFLAWSAMPDAKGEMVPDYKTIAVTIKTPEDKFEKLFSIVGFNKPIQKEDGSYEALPMSETEKKFIPLQSIRHIFVADKEKLLNIVNAKSHRLQKYPKIWYSQVEKLLERENRNLAAKGETLFSDFEKTYEALIKEYQKPEEERQLAISIFKAKESGDLLIKLYTDNEKIYDLPSTHTLVIKKDILDRKHVDTENLEKLLNSKEFVDVVKEVSPKFTSAYRYYDKYSKQNEMRFSYEGIDKSLEKEKELELPKDLPEIKLAR